MQSSAGNDFYDIRFKSSPTDSELIKIMKRTNPAVSFQFLRDLKSSGTPLMFTKLSQGNNGVYFYNSFKGSRIETSAQVTFSLAQDVEMSLSEIKKQSSGTFDIVGCIRYVTHVEDLSSQNEKVKLREAIIYDGSDQMQITLWNNFCDLEENVWLSFSNVTLKHYFQMKLNTTRTTTVTLSTCTVALPTLSETVYNEFKDLLNDIKSKLSNTLCCPVMKSVDIDFVDICTKCENPITIIPGKRIITCNHCSTSIRADRCAKRFNMELLLDDAKLTVPENVISSFLGEDVTEICKSTGRKEELIETLLFTEKVDYTYNSNKNIVSIMKKH